MPSFPRIRYIVTAVNGFHYCGLLRVIIIINAEKIILGIYFQSVRCGNRSSSCANTFMPYWKGSWCCPFQRLKGLCG